MPELTPAKQRALNAKLGKQSDISLAREFGITRQRVSEIRKAKNIPVYLSEFRADNKVNVGTHITKADNRRMGRAMKKTGTANRSEYIRDAIRDKNTDVLEE
jgi:hypothetical protein